MMRTIKLKLNEEGTWMQITKENIIGVTFEHKSTVIEILLPETVRDFDHYVDIKLPDESTYIVDELTIAEDEEGTTISFEVTEEMMSSSGRCYLQYVGRKDDGTVYKSKYTVELYIQKGINAHTPLDENEKKDIIALIRTIATEIIKELLDIEDDDDEWILLDGGIFGEPFNHAINGGMFSEIASQEIDGGWF
jgi:hypothetical protein